MVEVLHHELYDLRIIIDVVGVVRGSRIALDCLELDSAAITFLPHVNMAHMFGLGVANTYHESASLERALKVAGLSNEDNLVTIELVGSADQFAVRVLP